MRRTSGDWVLQRFPSSVQGFDWEAVPRACVKSNVTTSRPYSSHFLDILWIQPFKLPLLLGLPPPDPHQAFGAAFDHSTHHMAVEVTFLRWQPDDVSSLALTALYSSWLKYTCLIWPSMSVSLCSWYPLLGTPSFWCSRARALWRCLSFCPDSSLFLHSPPIMPGMLFAESNKRSHGIGVGELGWWSWEQERVKKYNTLVGEGSRDPEGIRLQNPDSAMFPGQIDEAIYFSNFP